MKAFWDRCTALICGALFFISLWYMWKYLYFFTDTLVHEETWYGGYVGVSIICSLVITLVLSCGAAVFTIAEVSCPRVMRESCDNVYDRLGIISLTLLAGALIPVVSMFVLSGIIIMVFVLCLILTMSARDFVVDLLSTD